MKNTLRLAIIGGLVAIGIAQSQAQSTNTNTIVTFTTNLEQVLNVTLTGFASGASNSSGVTSVRIGNKDIINSLSQATGVSFSPKARLILVSPVAGSSNSSPAVVVRDVLSRTNVDTDVSAFFSISTIGTPVVKSKTSSRGTTSGTAWSIENFIVGASGSDTNTPATSLFLDLQGFTTTTLSSGAFTSSVNGPATINQDNAVLQGRISAAAGKTKALAVSQ